MFGGIATREGGTGSPGAPNVGGNVRQTPFTRVVAAADSVAHADTIPLDITGRLVRLLCFCSVAAYVTITTGADGATVAAMVTPGQLTPTVIDVSKLDAFKGAVAKVNFSDFITAAGTLVIIAEYIKV